MSIPFKNAVMEMRIMLASLQESKHAFSESDYKKAKELFVMADYILRNEYANMLRQNSLMSFGTWFLDYAQEVVEGVRVAVPCPYNPEEMRTVPLNPGREVALLRILAKAGGQEVDILPAPPGVTRNMVVSHDYRLPGENEEDPAPPSDLD